MHSRFFLTAGQNGFGYLMDLFLILHKLALAYIY
ncbi:Hypothetical protein Tcol_840 [Trichococcus collinsii]|nr:Hypothetical protein Tcol_840 [Trichococcus collinsii]